MLGCMPGAVQRLQLSHDSLAFAWASVLGISVRHGQVVLKIFVMCVDTASRRVSVRFRLSLSPPMGSRWVCDTSEFDSSRHSITRQARCSGMPFPLDRRGSSLLGSASVALHPWPLGCICARVVQCSRSFVRPPCRALRAAGRNDV